METRVIYYFPVDAVGKETGEAIEVALAADGSADLSGLPEHLRNHLETFGAPDEMHRGILKPKEGSRFLDALVASSNPYRRFRASASPTV